MNIYDKKVKVDVVVPVYRGQKYIRGIIRQIEACLERTDGTVGISLVLVNDAPDDVFREDYSSTGIEVLAVETDRNRGIHGARVRGLSYCTGDYVVFLDQDDGISPDYFKSQLAAIGDADAVVCRAINGGRQFYNYDKQFEELTSFQYILSVGNGILSPGQVLMRRRAISRFWMENILQRNGADDWMLWLCMMYESMQFVRNEDVLYEHTIGSGNCSGSVLGMYQSEKDMYGILESRGYFNERSMGQLERAIHGGILHRLKELDRLKETADIYDTWLEVLLKNRSIAAFLKSAGCHKAAIYGMGKMGKRLYQEIRSEVEVKCFIDRNAAYLKADVPVYALEDDIPRVDLVIIALADRENKMMTDVSSRLHVRARGIENILQDILAEE